MARSRRIAALAAITALSLTACSSNDAKVSEVVDAVDEAGLDREQADCVGDRFDEEFDQDDLNEIGAADELDDLDPPELADQVRAILAECTGAGSPSSTEDTSSGDTSTSDTSGGEPSDSTDTTAG